MKKRKIIKMVLYGVVFALVAIQFVPVDRSVPEVDPNSDFLVAFEAPGSIKTLMQTACYDCHSYQSKYPWYAYVAPVSIWVQDHIDDGRKHLNFSKWASYDAERRDHKLEELVEEVGEGHMPLDSYLRAHPEARITDAQRKELTDWFELIR
ncbi:MAG: cytochrome C [Bacteroidetes bacterium]|nr:MAG: cytochrome C [Bacteroidota bacterium]